MIICDSDVMIEFLKGNEEVITQFKKIGEENIAITAVTLAELYYGAFNKKEISFIEKNLKNIKVFQITNEASKMFTNLMKLYAVSHNLRIADALIAAISISENIRLFSFNKKDFDFILDLKLYKKK